MFAGGENNAASHQGRGVAAVRDVLDRGRYLEIVEVGADEYIARVLRRRFERQVDVDSRVEADAGGLDELSNSGLVHCSENCLRNTRKRRKEGNRDMFATTMPACT